MTLFDLTGKRALVTGSSRGLGFSVAAALGRHGATVILNGRDDGALSQAVAKLRDEGIDAHPARFDLTDPDAAMAAIGQAVRTVGAVDILVNNAGVQLRKPFLDFALEDWRMILDVHLIGSVVASRAVLPGMVERQAGKIINICSLMSELGRPTIAPYASAKGALRMLTRNLAVEFARHNIQVNGIGPGYFATELNRALMDDPEFNTFVTRRTPAARWGRPDELGGAAVFLASTASDFVNGQIIYVDGGLLAAV
ncbi:SDR family oxidoreductase [Inquilinus limosus]|uniref:Gluconate 5-dehydrogenase n=1 Tax=Inquilinus limosus MP06 TaxID=1398085 RepID=A0A0A0CWU1_9PROT|nr:SDR family oxidoreductase [Inquilinus limosus]KGM30856.1 gluconate 5-dehydrogenase [Inquilinus limosus MP06]